MYKCEFCGAGLIYDPKSEKLLCLYCRKSIEPEKAKYYRFAKDKTVEESTEDGDTYSVIVHKCTQCGAELLSTNETISTFCSYCRSSATIESKVMDQNKPDYIIPFKIRKEECKDAYVKLIKRSFFAPKDMIDTQNVNKIRGIYMPYNVYAYGHKGKVFNRGEKYAYSSGDYKYYNQYSISAEIDSRYVGISHDTAKDFYDYLSEGISPFDFKEAKKFSPAYLSGFYADSEDIVDDKEYINKCQNIINDYVLTQIDLKSYEKYGCYHPKINLSFLDKRRALYPVYFLSTVNKTGDRISYAVMNGQTGRLAAEIPIDIPKFLICSILLSVPIFFLLNLFFVFTPIKVAIISIIFGILNLILLDNQSTQIYNKANKFDDYGFIGKPSKKIRPRFDVRLRNLIKPLLGIVISIAVLVLNPVSDYYYYLAAIISIVFVIWSVVDLIVYNNFLTTRKLPQLGKRGGDENA